MTIKDKHAHICIFKRISWVLYKSKDIVVLENPITPKIPSLILVLILRLNSHILKY